MMYGSRNGAATSVTLFGVFTVLLGVLSFAFPLISGVGLAILVGLVLLAAGIVRTVYAFRADTFARGAMRFVFGFISVLAGGILLAKPIVGVLSLSAVLLAWFFIEGVTEVAAALQIRPASGWIWMLISGMVSVGLAVFIWSRFPEAGIWLPGVLIGARFVFAGWAMIACGHWAGAAASHQPSALALHEPSMLRSQSSDSRRVTKVSTTLTLAKRLSFDSTTVQGAEDGEVKASMSSTAAL